MTRADAEIQRADVPALPRRNGRRFRRSLHLALLFVASVLVVDALAGERGLLETFRARRDNAELSGAVQALREENTALREQIRRLREDPAAIEEVARRELGMIEPGEIVIYLRTVDPK